METPLSPFTSAPKAHPAETLFLKYRHWLFAILFITLAAGIYLMLTPPALTLAQDKDAIPTDGAQSLSAGSTIAPADQSAQIVVDIAGAVMKPGVYFLNPQSIVEDGIKAAGGFNRLADLDAIAKTINRAASIETHSKIYIPKRGDNLAAIAPSATTTTSTSSSTVTTSKVNINTATTTELDILPGIGPVTAQRIIDYRLENGDFKSIDEIKNVPGISDGKFDALKNLITVD